MRNQAALRNPTADLTDSLRLSDAGHEALMNFLSKY